MLSKETMRFGVSLKPAHVKVKSVTGDFLPLSGKKKFQLFQNKAAITQHEFLGTPQSFKGFHGIIGNDWLVKHNADIKCGENCLYVHEFCIPILRDRCGPSVGLQKEPFCPVGEMCAQVGCRQLRKQSGTAGVTNNRSKDVITVMLTHDVLVPPRTGMDVVIRPTFGKKSDLCRGNEFLISPNSDSQSAVKFGRTVVTFDAENECVIPCMNVGDRALLLKKGRVVGYAEPFSDSSILCSYVSAEADENSENITQCFGTQDLEEDHVENPELIETLIAKVVSESECPEHLQQKLEAILTKNAKVLAKKGDPVGYCSYYQPTIPLDTEEPVFTPPYKTAQAMRPHLQNIIKQFLKEKIIRYSRSPYSSPAILVSKPDGTFRMCIDYRRLNKHVITDPFPLPRIDQILEELGGAKYFTCFDLLNGFYNLEIAEADKAKTAFSTFDGHYEFNRLPMGLKNSPGVFQRLMNLVLSGFLGHFCMIYIDDIIIYSETAEQHLQHIEQILEKLDEAGLRIKLSKCQIFRTSIKYLGYRVSQDGLMVEPTKLIAIDKFPKPKDVKGIQSFLGMIGYFRSFIKNFAEIARPMYDLLKKGIAFVWGKEQQKAFELLKAQLMAEPVLSFPDFSKPFILTTDASGYAIGAVLTQDFDDGEHLITCHSRSLKKSEKNYSNTDREILAVTESVKKNRSYLWGHKFVIKTDHIAIPYLNRQQTDNARALRFYNNLAEYDFTVEHKKGKSIAHADALSRYPYDIDNPEIELDDNEQLSAYISPVHQNSEYEPVWCDSDWKEATKKDKKDFSNKDNLMIQDGLFYKTSETGKKLLFVPKSLREYVLLAYHEPPAYGHAGRDKMVKQMSDQVWWPRMRAEIGHFVKHCATCQRFKNHSSRVASQPTTIPNILDEVSIDVVGPVPCARSGARYVLVTQDRLSRWVTFAAMSDASAETSARTFLTSWICSYGVPRKILTDRGTNFVSTIFRQLAEFLGAKPSKTCAYRPQSNGQNERCHRELHQFLSIYLSPASRYTWDTMLQTAAWTHNSSIHTALDASPFELLTGLKPRTAQAWLPDLGDTATDTIKTFQRFYGVDKKHLDQLRDKAKQSIEKMQESYLKRINTNLPAFQFKLHDLVLARNQDRRTLIGRKWSPKFLGPFKITKILSPAVFELENPKNGKRDLVSAHYVRPYHAKSPPPSMHPSDAESLNSDPESDFSFSPGVGEDENFDSDTSLLSLPGSDIDITYKQGNDQSNDSGFDKSPSDGHNSETFDTEGPAVDSQSSAPSVPSPQSRSILRNLFDHVRRSTRIRNAPRRYPN
jgi:transposase InsO family protein